MRTLIALLIATTLVLAACGDDESTPVSAGAGDDTETTDTTDAPATDAPATTEAPDELAPEPAEPVDEEPEADPEPVDRDDDVAAPSGEQLEAELAAARGRWATLDIDSYTMEQSIVAQLVEYVGPFTVTVTDGLVAEVAYAPAAPSAGGTPPADVGVATVEEIFDAIDAAIGTADEVRVTYDAETGVPTEVWIDESYDLADEERGYTVALTSEG